MKFDFWIFGWCPPSSQEGVDPDFSEDRWTFRNAKQRIEDNLQCSSTQPSPKDVIRRLYAILPYFDKDHANSVFLHKFRATIYGLSEATDLLDKEVSYYAAVMTPLVFLQQQRDMWCLLERISHPTEKRSALKLLQNLRAVNKKIRSMIVGLPGPAAPARTTLRPVSDDEDLHDKKDIRYLKELIKNLG